MAAVRIFVSNCCCFQWACSEKYSKIDRFVVFAEVQHELAVFEYEIGLMSLADHLVDRKIDAPSESILNSLLLANRLI